MNDHCDLCPMKGKDVTLCFDSARTGCPVPKSWYANQLREQVAALKEQSKYDHAQFNKEFKTMVDKKEEQIATLKELATNLASENKEAAKQVATLSAEKIDYLRFDKELVERNVALTTENKVLRE